MVLSHSVALWLAKNDHERPGALGGPAGAGKARRGNRYASSSEDSERGSLRPKSQGTRAARIRSRRSGT